MTTGVLPTPFPGAVSSTRQKIEFRERNISAYAAQLFGDGFSVGARYRLSEAQLETRLPELPNSTTDLNLAEQSECSLLHQVSLLLNYQHTCGFFSQWESLWYYQDNSGYTPVRPGDDFLQHNVWVATASPAASSRFVPAC